MLEPDETDRLNIDRPLRETFVARAEYHQVIGSTNDRAKQLAGGTPPQLPLLVVAERQTAGRGRAANRWWTGRGNLAISLLLDLEPVLAEPARVPLLGLASAVALVETVRPLVQQPLGIHWPNDVFAGAGKLAGILVEIPRWPYGVIGVGVNVNASLGDAPEHLRPRITSLRALTGVAQDRTALLISLLGNLEQQLRRLGEDGSAVAARAHEMCLQRGRRLTVCSGGRAMEGLCRGIGPDGALLVDTVEGLRRCYSGVVEST